MLHITVKRTVHSTTGKANILFIQFSVNAAFCQANPVLWKNTHSTRVDIHETSENNHRQWTIVCQ